MESTTSKGLPGAEKTSYTYDENNRLTKAGTASYEYDAANNMTKAPGTTNAYDKDDELESGTNVTYTYNEIGERTKTMPSVGPATSYGYNQAGSLTSVKRPKEGETAEINDSYAYNGLQLLASRTISGTTTYMTWNSTGALPLTLSDGQSSYIYGPNGLPIEQISSAETPTYCHHDQLGSTRMLTNASGESTSTFTYGAYGSLEGSTGTQTTPLGFAGQYTEAGSGLQDLRTRFYDPGTGQLLTRDPLTALTQSPYGYADQDPLKYFDPTGMLPDKVGPQPTRGSSSELVELTEELWNAVSEADAQQWRADSAILKGIGHGGECILRELRKAIAAIYSSPVGVGAGGCIAGLGYAGASAPELFLDPWTGAAAAVGSCIGGGAMALERPNPEM